MAEFTLASIPVVFEDENVIIFNKPGGLLSIEDGFQPDLPNLRSMLKKEYGRIWAVHRLDKDTSGIILFAKNAETHRYLNGQFSDRMTSKAYQAVVHGFPIWSEKHVELSLKTNGDRKHRTIIDPLNGKKASSSIKLLNKLAAFSLFRIEPASGYTHQIRAHCAAIGFPIVGDHLYLRGCQIGAGITINRILLHAMSLEISLAFGEKTRIFTVSPPVYFQDFLSEQIADHA